MFGTCRANNVREIHQPPLPPGYCGNAVLDVRTFNTDRHSANLLVKRPTAKPRPRHHSFSGGDLARELGRGHEHARGGRDGHQPSAHAAAEVRHTISGDLASFDEAQQAALKSTLADSVGCYAPACLLVLRLASGSISVAAILTIPEAGGSATATAVSHSARSLILC